jgi:hypothetical protein
MCAPFWFRLFERTEPTHARHHNDYGATPILLAMEWKPRRDEHYEIHNYAPFLMRSYYGETSHLLTLGRPVSGMSYERELRFQLI